MARKDANPGAREAALLRRRKALELRIGGNSFRAIATATGVDVKQAFADVQKALTDAAPPLDSDQIAEYRRLADERLDFVLRRIVPLIDRAEPDLAAVARLVQVEARRAALWGLDAPQKWAPTDPTGEKPWAPGPGAVAALHDQLTQWEQNRFGADADPPAVH